MPGSFGGEEGTLLTKDGNKVCVLAATSFCKPHPDSTEVLDSALLPLSVRRYTGVPAITETSILRLMDKILHDPKDSKLWELRYIPYNG